MVRRPSRRLRDARALGPGAAVALHARLVPAVGAVPLDRERRSGVLRLRLGDAPARGRVPGHLPRPLAGARTGTRGPAVAMGAVPRRVRSGAHQAPRRPVLAPAHVPGLPSRDTTAAQPRELVRPPPPARVPPPRDRRQPRHAAHRALGVVRAPTGGLDRRSDHPGDAGVARRERQLRLAQRPDHDAGALGLRRRGARARHGPRAGGRGPAPARTRPGRLRRDRPGDRPERPPRPQPAVARSAHERQLRSPAPRQHLRCLRQRHARALRDRAGRRAGGGAMARVRVPSQARRPRPASAAGRPVPPAARLAAVVRGDVGSLAPPLDAHAGAAPARGRPPHAGAPRAQPVPRRSADPRSGAAVPLPLHVAARTAGHGAVVEPHAGRRVPPPLALGPGRELVRAP